MVSPVQASSKRRRSSTSAASRPAWGSSRMTKGDPSTMSIRATTMLIPSRNATIIGRSNWRPAEVAPREPARARQTRAEPAGAAKHFRPRGTLLRAPPPRSRGPRVSARAPGDGRRRASKRPAAAAAAATVAITSGGAMVATPIPDQGLAHRLAGAAHRSAQQIFSEQARADVHVGRQRHAGDQAEGVGNPDEMVRLDRDAGPCNRPPPSCCRRWW